MELMAMMYQWELTDNVQIVMATHSPLLMAYPGADVRWFDGESIAPIAYEDIPHVQITKGFLANPERHLRELLADS